MDSDDEAALASVEVAAAEAEEVLIGLAAVVDDAAAPDASVRAGDELVLESTGIVSTEKVLPLESTSYCCTTAIVWVTSVITDVAAARRL